MAYQLPQVSNALDTSDSVGTSVRAEALRWGTQWGTLWANGLWRSLVAHLAGGQTGAFTSLHHAPPRSPRFGRR